MDVVFLLPFRKFGFQYHEEVISVFVLERYSLGEGWHFSWCQVYSSLYISCAVVEEEHVGVVLSSEVFESSYDGDSVEALSFEDGVVGEFLVELVKCEWYDGSIIDGFIFFFGGILHFVGACFNYIIRRNYPSI